MARRRTSTQEMMAWLEVIEEEDAITRSSVEGVHMACWSICPPCRLACRA